MINRLKNTTEAIGKQLKKEKETRSSLYDYLDKGGQALKRTN